MTRARVPAARPLRYRPERAHGCWDHLLVAPLWPKYDDNLGTLLRTCDAVGACLAVPRSTRRSEALARGNTLSRQPCVHWVRDEPLPWLLRQRERGTHLVGAELTERSVRLGDLRAARRRTVVVLGHERDGIPEEVIERLDLTVEIPMLGVGRSLNVAVAGSLLLYRLAGLA